MTPEDEVSQEIRRLEQQVVHETPKWPIRVSIAYLWITGILGVLIGFIAGKVT
jgi:hypothetical protein